MKKSTLLIAGLLALGSTAMHADEGMWTLYNLPEAVYEQMVAEGFQLPQAMLYGAPNAISNQLLISLAIAQALLSLRMVWSSPITIVGLVQLMPIPP